jgi:DNA-binding MarR family transcriptional regulator
VRLLSLTVEGRRALEQAMPLWEKAQRRVVGGLGPKRWHELLDGLNAASVLKVEG